VSAALFSRLLDVVERDIVPLTRRGVAAGNKIFGAAILRDTDSSLVVAGTNEETACPLWHGEVAAIRNLYELPAEERPAPAECLFLSTHEPCSMCLSAITWSGYRSIYYLFDYEQTRDRFHIPHDLRILKEVFRCEDGGYARENAYWMSHDIVQEIERLAPSERDPLLARVTHLRAVYDELSDRYQSTKATKDGREIPLP
jgi:tRNA(Arg) A34 adenosine deaminase TadA